MGEPMTKKTPVASILLSVLSPILVLLSAIFLASILAYLAVLVFGDDISFRTVFKKATQFFLVLSLFPLMYWLQFSKKDLGISNNPLFIKQLKNGFCLGIVTLLPVLILLFWLGVYEIDGTKPWTAGWLGKRLLLDGLLALLIAVVEEPLFRGVLLTGLNKTLPVAWAIAVSAFYYAGLHFVNSNIEIPAQDAGLLSGFLLLGDALGNLDNSHYVTPFFGLFTVGVFLGLLRTQINAGLSLCIGCHAAWVWQIKLCKVLFNVDPKSPFLYLVSGYDGVIGPFITLWLVLAMIAYYGYQRHRKVWPLRGKKSAE